MWPQFWTQRVTHQKQKRDVRLGDYDQVGLYLILKDSTRLVLTREGIEKLATEYWVNPDKIPPGVKEVAEFQRCPFCPLKGKEDFCNALRPVLPLLDVVDNYVSFDKVLAIYKPEDKQLLHISDTSMQEGLAYVATLSLMDYCQVGRKYRRYYFGIIPIIGFVEFANRLYLNIYWIHGGNRESTEKAISDFNEQITITTQNQVARLRLICKNDAFINAFVNAQSIPALLHRRKDTYLQESFNRFQKT